MNNKSIEKKPDANLTPIRREIPAEEITPKEVEEVKDTIANYDFYPPFKPISLLGIDNSKGGMTKKEIMSCCLETLSKKLNDKAKRDKVIDGIFSEMIKGAYQDRVVLYTYCVRNPSDTAGLEKIQGLRQKADKHLLHLIQTYKNITKQPIKVVVKQKVDKQVALIGDLDKKNEKPNG